MKPTVSVIMPAFNSADTISQALESVRAQTLAEFELLVVDDGSRDATGEIICRLAESEPRIRYFRQVTAGPSAARNLALDHARGEFTAFLDADDLWLPHALEILVAAAEQSAHGTAYARFEYTRPDGTPTDLQPGWPDRVIGLPELLDDFHFPIHTWTIRRDQLDDTRFDPALGSWEDLDLLQKLSLRGLRFEPIKEIIARYRLSPGSQSRRCRLGAIGRLAVQERGFLAARALGWDKRDPFDHARPGIDLSEARLGRLLAAHCHTYAALSLLGDSDPLKSKAREILGLCPERFRTMLRISGGEAALAACRHIPYSQGKLIDAWAQEWDSYLPHALAWWDRLVFEGFASASLPHEATRALIEQVDASSRVPQLLADACPAGKQVVLHGLGRNGRRLARELARRGIAFTAHDDEITAAQITREMPELSIDFHGPAKALDDGAFHIFSMLESKQYTSRFHAPAASIRWSDVLERETVRVRADLSNRLHPLAAAA